MKNREAKLEPDSFYHIYNRANGNESLFANEDNYQFFLEKLKVYVCPVVDILSYCLTPNHFHFLMRIKSEAKLQQTIQNVSKDDTPKTVGANYISKQFSNFFNSYTQAFNKVHNRKGSLFMKPFHRKKVTEKTYLLQLVLYIHNNPVKAGLVKNPEEWKFSSYSTIVSPTLSLIQRDEVIALFDNLDNFVYCHTEPN